MTCNDFLEDVPTHLLRDPELTVVETPDPNQDISEDEVGHLDGGKVILSDHLPINVVAKPLECMTQRLAVYVKPSMTGALLCICVVFRGYFLARRRHGIDGW